MEGVQSNFGGVKHDCENGKVSDNAATTSLPNGGPSSDLDSILRCSEPGGSEEDEASAFFLDQEMEQNSKDASAKFLLAHEVLHTNLAGVDPATQAKLQALLEAAGIGELPNADGRLMPDNSMMPNYTSSVGCALNEAAAALTRMRSDNSMHPLAIDRTLAEACSDGDVGAVRKLLSEGRSVNETTDEGESLLSLACCAGYYELAEVLLAMKANVEDRGVKGDLTPLMEAAGRGYTDIARLLIAHGADINAQSNIGSTALHCAAGGGHEDIVRMLIDAGAGVEDQNENGHTPLMEAASAGHVGVARLLLKCGAGINTHSSEFKESALTLACYKGHLEMAKFLLEAGADQEHKTDEMHTALMEASMDGHVEVARLLLDSGAQVNMPADSFESPLTLAACGGHVELANLLIERGANLEEVNDEGYTPLMEAAREGHEEMVALLLAHGAFINAQTEETQETALTLACCGGFVEVAEFLIKAGADIELGCSTPLMEAAQEGHYDLVRHLISAGAIIHAQTGNGDTALTYACENGHTDIAELLLLAGAELEHESEGGRTPLMKAARAGHLCTVQFLINRGADVNRATSTNDHTVLSLACAGGHLAVVELLLCHHADPAHKLKDGSTMLIEAARGGHTQVVNMLLDFPNFKVASRQMASGTLPLSLETTDALAGIDDGTALDQEMLTSRLEQFINKMMAQADGVDASSACGDAEEQQLHQAKKQEILSELHRVELELRGRRTAMAAAGTAAAASAPYDALAEAAPSFGSALPQAQWQQLVQQQQQNEQQLQQQKEYYQYKLQQQLKQQYHQKQLQLQQKQQLLEQAKNPLPLLPPQPSAAAAASPVSSPASLSAVLLPPPPSPASPDAGSPPLPLQQLQVPGTGARRPVPLHIALQGLLQAHGVAEGNVSDLAQALQDWDNRDRNIVYPSEVKPMPAFFSQRLGDEGYVVGRDDSGRGDVSSASTAAAAALADGRPSLPLQDASSRMAAAAAAEESAATQQSLARVLAALIQGQSDGSIGPAGGILAKAADIDGSALWSAALSGEAAASVAVLPAGGHRGGKVRGGGGSGGGHIGAIVPLSDDEDDEVNDDGDNEEDEDEDRRQQLDILSQLQQLNLGGGRCAEVLASVSTTALAQQLQPPPPGEGGGGSLPPLHCHPSLADVPHKALPTSPLPPSRSAPASPPHGVPVVDPNAATESNHDTALTLACAGGHAELVQLLLSRKAEIEHKDKKGFTPLILAATAGHVDVVEILLEQGAEIEAQSERTKDTALSLACSGGRYEVVELLLRRGANKEHRNVSDYTPLSLAASGGYVNIIKLLLNYGAEINSRTGSKLGISPLMLAAMNGHTAAVKILLDMGSDINAQIETNRNTALTLACFQGRHEVVSLLVDRKANIEHRAKTGLTPLMEAASGGYVEVGRVLLDKGADVNASPVPSSRDTALTIAADKGHYRFVELLLSHGASVDVKNKKGNSPLWLASNGGHLDVVQLLVGAGADIDSQDNRRVTCLMAAFRKGHLKVVKWLVRHVSQFPSDNECARYISTATDKELLKKCQQCMDVIVAAKDRQAAEANKNATSLLEEIETEKSREEKRREAAARKREKKKQKRKEKQLQQQQQMQPHEKSVTGPGTEDDDDDEDEDADAPVPHPGNHQPTGRSQQLGSPAALCNGDGSADYRRHASMIENKENTCVKDQVHGDRRVTPGSDRADPRTTASSALGVTGVACNERVRGNGYVDSDSVGRKLDPAAAPTHTTSNASSCEFPDCNSPMTQKKNKKNRRQSNDDVSLRNVNSSGPPSALDRKGAMPSSNYTAADSAAASRRVADGSNTSNNSSAARSNDVVVLSHPSVMPPRASLSGLPAKAANSKKTRADTGAPVDDASVSSSSSQKNSKQRRLGSDEALGNQTDVFEKRQLIAVSPGKATNSGKPGVSPSPKKGKREDGWKEVVRKSKKIAVPAAAAGRVLGRAALAAVRELSGASVDVDALDSSLGGDRSLTVKGSAEATRHAHSLITSLIQNPEREVEDLLGKKKGRRQQQPQQQLPGALTAAGGAAAQHGDRSDEYSIGTFSIADFIVSSAPPSAAPPSTGDGGRPKYSAAVLSGGLAAASATVASGGMPKPQQQLKLQQPPRPQQQQAAAPLTARAPIPAAPSPRSPAPAPLSHVPMQSVSGPRLLVRTSQDVSRQLFPCDPPAKDHSVGGAQPLATTLPASAATLLLPTTTPPSGSAPVAVASSMSAVFTNSNLSMHMPKNGGSSTFNGPTSAGRVSSVSGLLGAPAAGSATLPEGAAAAAFTPFDSGLKLGSGSKPGLSFATAAAVGLVEKPPSGVAAEADPAKAPGFRPPSLGTPDSLKDGNSGLGKVSQSPRSAVAAAAAAGGQQFRAGIAAVHGADDAVHHEFPLSYHPVPPPAFPYAYGRAAFPVSHFYEGMHSGLKSPSVLSPRSTAAMAAAAAAAAAAATAARDEYTTPDQPMTLPRISSSLNPNASEFRATHGDRLAEAYAAAGHLMAGSINHVGFHSQPSQYAESAYLGPSFPAPLAAAAVAAAGSAAPSSSSAVAGMLLQPIHMMMAPNYSLAPGRGRQPVQPPHVAVAAADMPAASGAVGMRPGSVGSGESASSPSPPMGAGAPTTSSAPGSSPQQQERTAAAAAAAEDRLQAATAVPAPHGTSQRPIGTERMQKKQQQLLPLPPPSAASSASFATPIMAVDKPVHLQPTAGAPAPVSSIWTAFPTVLSQDWPSPMLGQHAALPMQPLLTTILPTAALDYSDSLSADGQYKMVDSMTSTVYNTFPGAPMFPSSEVVSKPSWNSPLPLRPMASSSSVNRNIPQESDWSWPQQPTPPNS